VVITASFRLKIQHSMQEKLISINMMLTTSVKNVMVSSIENRCFLSIKKQPGKTK